MATFRDDAYPYVYPRDATIMTMALNLCGFYDRSKRFYKFLNGLRRKDGEFFQRYNKGFPYVTRSGEHDVTPLVLQGIYDTYKRSADRAFLEEMWKLTNEGATFVLNSIDSSPGLIYTLRSIHENRVLEEGFEIWANCSSAKGLLDASRMAKELGYYELSELWENSSRTLLNNVLEKLYDHDKGLFIKGLRPDGTRVESPDISELAPFYFGVCDDRAALERTLRHLKGTIWNVRIGGFKRFRDFEVVQDWHWYTGGIEDSWPIFTIWGSKFYRRLGMIEEAEECLKFVEEAADDEMYIPERVASVRGYLAWKENEREFSERILRGIAKVERSGFNTKIPDHVKWAFPLGWAHAEFILLEKQETAKDHELLESEIKVPQRVERPG
ncbi:MAG: hypothetical protein HYY68_02640 [Thaumarchaeota archaeon]|nr:hypothetical protein [Nitrososphaerota archaeon]